MERSEFMKRRTQFILGRRKGLDVRVKKGCEDENKLAYSNVSIKHLHV